MNKYEKGKIYKITSEQSDDVYYGSTIKTLKHRLSEHKGHHKHYLENKHGYITSFKIIIFDDCKIELVQNFPCDCKEDLYKREGYYIRKYECVNEKIAGRTKKEYARDNKIKIAKYQKEYARENKEKLAEYHAKYHELNKETVREQSKVYYLLNKEKSVARAKAHYEKQKHLKYQCTCGAEVNYRSKGRHLKTNAHITFEADQAEN